MEKTNNDINPDECIRNWLESVRTLTYFRAAIEPEYYDDSSGIPELADDFPIYEDAPEDLDINIRNEADEFFGACIPFFVISETGMRMRGFNMLGFCPHCNFAYNNYHEKNERHICQRPLGRDGIAR